MKKLFVFDLDDTLIDNVHDYADPLLDACRLIIKTLGNKAPHVSKIIALASNRQVILTAIGDAFPMRFGPEDLGIHYDIK